MRRYEEAESSITSRILAVIAVLAIVFVVYLATQTFGTLKTTTARNSYAASQPFSSQSAAASSFDGATTDFSRVDASRVEKLTLERQGLGKIVFNGVVDARGIDFDRVVKMENNYVSVDSFTHPQLKNGGTVTFSDQKDASQICYDENADAKFPDYCTPCPENVCSPPQFDGGAITFTANEFSSFQLSNLLDVGDASATGVGEETVEIIASSPQATFVLGSGITSATQTLDLPEIIDGTRLLKEPEPYETNPPECGKIEITVDARTGETTASATEEIFDSFSCLYQLVSANSADLVDSQTELLITVIIEGEAPSIILTNEWEVVT